MAQLEDMVIKISCSVLNTTNIQRLLLPTFLNADRDILLSHKPRVDDMPLVVWTWQFHLEANVRSVKELETRKGGDNPRRKC